MFGSASASPRADAVPGVLKWRQPSREGEFPRFGRGKSRIFETAVSAETVSGNPPGRRSCGTRTRRARPRREGCPARKRRRWKGTCAPKRLPRFALTRRRARRRFELPQSLQPLRPPPPHWSGSVLNRTGYMDRSSVNDAKRYRRSLSDTLSSIAR